MRFVNYTILVEIILCQILLTFSIGLLLSVIFTVKEGLIFILGGGLSIIPGGLFGRIFFKTLGIGKAKTIVNTFYCGEVLKLILTMALFAGVFHWQAVAPRPLFAGFVVAQGAYWFALIRLKSNR